MLSYYGTAPLPLPAPPVRPRRRPPCALAQLLLRLDAFKDRVAGRLNESRSEGSVQLTRGDITGPADAQESDWEFLAAGVEGARKLVCGPGANSNGVRHGMFRDSLRRP